MEQTFSRRGFLKGAAAAALAVSAMGLTGCSTDAGAEPSTAVILGDYKVDLDLKRSVLGKNGDGSATVKLSVFVTNNDAGAAAMPFIRSMFPSLYAGKTELKAGNSKTEFATLPMRVPTECTPQLHHRRRRPVPAGQQRCGRPETDRQAFGADGCVYPEFWYADQNGRKDWIRRNRRWN